MTIRAPACWVIGALCTAVFAAIETPCASTTIVTTADELRAALARLEPGDELVLRAGVYAFDSRVLIRAAGEPDRPIVIRGADGDDVLIRMRTRRQNIVEIDGSRHVTLRNLRFRGGSHGIRLLDSDFVSIENSEVFDTGDVAISANAGGTYEGLVIRGNHIHHTSGTGEGLYLGCNHDECRVLNSVIEWNYVHDTNGPAVEQGDGIELKEGSAGNIVRHNVVHATRYAGIITYGTLGNGPPNVIEGNLIWGADDNAIQSAADAVIRNNIVIGSPIALQPHQNASPSNLEVVHNTVIADGSGIVVRGAVGPVVIANNAVYSRRRTAITLDGDTRVVTVAGNIGSGGISGAAAGYTEGFGIATDFVGAHYGGAPPIDLFPAPESALLGAGSRAFAAPMDFNEQPRTDEIDAGAYAFAAGGNPGWPLTAAHKAKPEPLPDKAYAEP